MIALASFSGQWNDVLPSHLTLAHYVNALHGDSAEQARVSIITGLAASAAGALLRELGGARAAPPRARCRSVFSTCVFFVPSAVPSVSVGLGLLVAFSQPPVLLNGTVAIVLIAHFVLISRLHLRQCLGRPRAAAAGL